MAANDAIDAVRKLTASYENCELPLADNRAFARSGNWIMETLHLVLSLPIPWRSTMIKEHDCVVLTQDLPEEKMQAGDIGTVVHVHRGGLGYEVEFMTLAGETVAVITLLPAQVRPIARRDIAHVRELQAV